MLRQPRIAGVVSCAVAISGLMALLFVTGCGSGGIFSTPATYTVGGHVAGLLGSGLALQDKGGNTLPVSANGSFVFTTALASGAAYSVTVSTQPTNPAQTCGVKSASGTVTNAAITNVDVTCTNSLVVADYTNNRVLIYDIPFSTGQAATVVLGQAAFTTSFTGITANTMSKPGGVAMDGAGNLYVSENGNCRVTQFVPPFVNGGMGATVVFGQPNFISGNCPTTTGVINANSLGNGRGDFPPLGGSGDNVFGVTVDGSGDLWVGDSGSNRVLEYVPPFTNGMPATLAIGQPNLTSGSPNQGGISGSTLYDPGLQVFDSAGSLWIPEFGNNRVLEFKPPFSTGMLASVVLGQPDFNHGSANQGLPVAANTLSGADGPAFDSSGNLWIADFGNNRVLEFKPPFNSDMSASLVLGQVDLMHGLANQGGATPTQTTLFRPTSVSFDSGGNLFVTDAGNRRTLVFSPPFINGMNASLVIGQAGFASATAATTATGQSDPLDVLAAPPF